MEISQYMDFIESKLQNSFDFTRNYSVNNFEYDLFAEYHLRNESYILVKKAVLYAFENNEYCLIKYYKDLNKISYKNFIDALTKSVETVVKPSKEHMSSVITGVIVTDNVRKEDLEYILEAVKKFKYNKGFSFGFKGWADIRLVLVSLNECLIANNKKGKEVSKVYKFF